MSKLEFKTIKEYRKDKSIFFKPEDQAFLAEMFHFSLSRVKSKFALVPPELLYGENAIQNIENPDFDFHFDEIDPTIIKKLEIKKKFFDNKQIQSKATTLFHNLTTYEKKSKTTTKELKDYYTLLEVDPKGDHMVRAIIKTSLSNGVQFATNPAFAIRMEKIKQLRKTDPYLDNIEDVYLINPNQSCFGE